MQNAIIFLKLHKRPKLRFQFRSVNNVIGEQVLTAIIL